jgi:hypothetical protein
MNNRSRPFSSFATIRPFSVKDGTDLDSISKQMGFTSAQGIFCLYHNNPSHSGGEPSLCTVSVSAFRSTFQNKSIQKGFIIGLRSPAFVEPVKTYLESAAVRSWIEHTVEKKGSKWNLDETLLRLIPVPNALVEALENSVGSSGLWDSILKDPLKNFSEIEKKLSEVRLSTVIANEMKNQVLAMVFVEISRSFDQKKEAFEKMRSFLGEDNRLKWREYMSMLPPSEKLFFNLHPSVILGTLSAPPHTPIIRAQITNTPKECLHLFFEKLPPFEVRSTSKGLIDILKNQIDSLIYPTWNDLIHTIELPRSIEIAQSSETQLLHSVESLKESISKLGSLLNICLGI